MILANVDGGATSVVADVHAVPGIHVDHVAGTAIEAYIETVNADPKPFRWTKSADDILASIKRFCLASLGAPARAPSRRRWM